LRASAPEIVVTTDDHDRLQRLIESGIAREPVASQLQEELDRAVLVEPDEAPADIVRMDSRFVAQDLDTGERLSLHLVWPAEAQVEEGRISILAPVGAALLGLRVGQTIDWPLPSGRARRLRVLEVSGREGSRQER
jgi:regulator of nucleoside diphosphate kinase